MSDGHKTDNNIEIWKIKSLMKALEAAPGNGTSASTSAQERLKLYNKGPPNRLVLYIGTIITDERKEKKVTFDFSPLGLSMPLFIFATSSSILKL
ncbi:hypothetical protein AgCh_002713 [Apium graveolens]